MSELFRRYPLAIVLSVVVHVAVAALTFVVLERPAEEQSGDLSLIHISEPTRPY